MSDEERRARAVALVVQAILETIEETGKRGAPLGVLYAALMGMISYETFTQCISALVEAKAIRVSNHCAFRVLP
jgi:hypothetical protein